jgi:hypothetical protein
VSDTTFARCQTEQLAEALGAIIDTVEKATGEGSDPALRDEWATLAAGIGLSMAMAAARMFIVVKVCGRQSDETRASLATLDETVSAYQRDLDGTREPAFVKGMLEQALVAFERGVERAEVAVAETFASRRTRLDWWGLSQTTATRMATLATRMAKAAYAHERKLGYELRPVPKIGYARERHVADLARLGDRASEDVSHG